MFPSSTKREIRHRVVVVQRRLRNVPKRRDARAKLLFCQFRPIGFFAILVAVAVVVAEVPFS